MPARLPSLLRGSCHPAGAASWAHPTGRAALAGTIRLKLLKIGAIVRVRVLRIVFKMSSAYVWTDVYARAFHTLGC